MTLIIGGNTGTVNLSIIQGMVGNVSISIDTPQPHDDLSIIFKIGNAQIPQGNITRHSSPDRVTFVVNFTQAFTQALTPRMQVSGQCDVISTTQGSLRLFYTLTDILDVAGARFVGYQSHFYRRNYPINRYAIRDGEVAVKVWTDNPQGVLLQETAFIRLSHWFDGSNNTNNSNLIEKIIPISQFTYTQTAEGNHYLASQNVTQMSLIVSCTLGRMVNDQFIEEPVANWSIDANQNFGLVSNSFLTDQSVRLVGIEV